MRHRFIANRVPPARHSVAEMRRQLKALVGLKLSIARRAADMRVLHFGRVRRLTRGSIGQFALHIQCDWRMEGPGGIITGRDDLWTLPNGELSPKGWNYEHGNNLQDVRLGEVLRGYDKRTRSYVNRTKQLVVEKIWASRFGDATLSLSGGYRLVISPMEATGEAWRLFVPCRDEPHFVVCANGMDEEDD